MQQTAVAYSPQSMVLEAVVVESHFIRDGSELLGIATRLGFALPASRQTLGDILHHVCSWVDLKTTASRLERETNKYPLEKRRKRL